MKARGEWKLERKTRRTLMISLLWIFVGLLIFFILPISMPLILAFFTAAIFDPWVRWLMKRIAMKRNWAVLTVFMGYLLTLSISCYIFISRGFMQALYTIERIPVYTTSFLQHWERWSENIIAAAQGLPLSLINEINSQLDGMLYSVTEPLRNFDYLNTVTAVATWIPVVIVSILVYLIAAFLFMLDLSKLRNFFYSHLKDETAEKIRFMFARLTAVVRGFFKAQFLVSLVIFVVCYIGLLFISPKAALVMAIVVWVIDFIPIIGSIIILGPWAIIALVLGNGFESASLAVLAVILLIIRRTLEPKVMGQYIGLSPLATLISMFLGVKLLGMVGFLVGPLVIIAYQTAKEAGIIKMDFKI
jgi:sporulation integral membrane protein YtvI